MNWSRGASGFHYEFIRCDWSGRKADPSGYYVERRERGVFLLRDHVTWRCGRMFINFAAWRLLRSIEAYPEPNPPMHYISVTAVTFSPDSSMIAVGTFGGGTWTEMNTRPPDAPKTGPVISFPPDPLRILKVSDGSKVSSLGSFPGGFLHQDRFAWLPNGRTIVFLDAVGNIRVWRCLEETSSSVVGAVHQAESIKLSGDGRELAVSYPDGVKLFDVSMILE